MSNMDETAKKMEFIKEKYDSLNQLILELTTKALKQDISFDLLYYAMAEWHYMAKYAHHAATDLETQKKLDDLDQYARQAAVSAVKDFNFKLKAR